MATPFTLVGFAAREQVLSSDAMRLQKLWSRAFQELARLQSIDSAGLVIDGFVQRPTLAPTGGTFNEVISDGSALVNSSAGVTADDSAYQVLSWLSQTLVFATPDAVNPRIDLVCAALGTAAEDVSVRNVLVDPVNRTIVPTPVPKTYRPSATLQVVTGTPGVTPSPSALPVGNFALMEVYVPAASADATSFRSVHRMGQRAPFPFSNLHGVVSGVDLRWTQVDPAAASSVLSLSLSPNRRHRVIIDGELLDFSGLPPVFQDLGGNNPFSAAAPATTDRAYYIYLVGGRHALQGWAGASASFSPVAIVESRIEPNISTGKPSSAVRDPRTGATTIDGALYVGLGWVYRNTTNRRPVMMAGGWAFAAGGRFEAKTDTSLSAGTNAYPPLASAPSFAGGGGSGGGLMMARVDASAAGAAHSLFIRPTVANIEGGFAAGAPLVIPTAGGLSVQLQLWFDPNVGAIFSVDQANASDLFNITPMAYQVAAIRLDGRAFS